MQLVHLELASTRVDGGLQDAQRVLGARILGVRLVVGPGEDHLARTRKARQIVDVAVRVPASK